MQRLILIILSSFIFLASPALAKGKDAAMWVVSQRSGDARVIRGGLQPASLTVNSALAPGDIVMTGATGRATLARGSDYIVVAPRSELRLPATAQPGGFTRVIQTLGTMLFKVRHTGTPHFAVDTPMLAAVVKGTTFTVIVSEDRSAVQVIEGAVEVRATDGGMARLVEGGRTVFIDHAKPQMLIDADLRSPDVTATSSSAVSISGSAAPSLTEIANLTGGLVRPAPTPAPTSMVTAPTLALIAPTTAATAPGPSAPTVRTPGITEPVVAPVDTVPAATEAIADTVETTVPAVTEPVVDIVETLPTVTEPVVDLVEETVEVIEPVVDETVEVVDPVVEETVGVVDPVVEETVEVVEPVVDETVEVVEPVVEETVEVVEPVVDETVEVVEPVVDETVEVVEPVVDETVEVVEPVVDETVEVIEPVVEETVEVVEPVVEVIEPVVEVIEPVVEPVVEVIEPVVDLVPGPGL